jgi:hypothetical protein
MEAILFIKQYNSKSYDNLGLKKFSFLPRTDEFISIQHDGVKFFQITAILHTTIQQEPAIEIYAVQTEPTWESRQSGNIGFSFS